ncbi:MAG: TonB-dependent receptor [Acidobacteria bacterium]|nr:TonB-dependent receptor [Acidobacteriota bacterium]
MKKSIFVFAFIFVIGLSGVDVRAQQAATATLSGVVMDPSGAVIAGARITASQITTGAKRETVTNSEGVYALLNLAPGEYEIRVEAKGFTTKVSQAPVSLRVGQNQVLDVTLAVGSIQETVTDLTAGLPIVNTSTTVVDGVVSGKVIENLPINGRNFLELALLIPGNAPAPNFDPTKSNSVIISSAGQLGRGGNVTIDGADNNDDAVGGPLINITQEAVLEFQIATNRFSAELGRTGSSVINVVTKSGSNEMHGSASFFERDKRIQGLPATFDRRNPAPPFDRQQYAFSLGGPMVKDHLWWFGAFEYRNQDGAVLVGERNVATKTITRNFAPAPLNDPLGLVRIDWHPGERDQIGLRYAIERAEDTSVSTLERSIGSAAQRQQSRNNYHSFLGNWTRTLTPTVLNSFNAGFTNYENNTQPTGTGPQLTFPSLQDGSSFRVPQKTKLNRFQMTETLAVLRGAHSLKFGGEVQRISSEFDLGVFQQGRIEMVQDFADFDRNGDGRVDDNDLLFAVTLRSATPTRSLLLPGIDNTHLALFIQDDWRIRQQLTLNLGLRYELDTDVKNISGYDRINPLVRPFLKGDRGRDLNNFGPRAGFNWSTRDGHMSFHGGYGIYYDRVTLEVVSLERGLDGRSLSIAVRAGNALRDPGTGAPIFIDPASGRFRPGAPTLASPFSGFILPGAGAAGIDIIDNGLQNPMVQQFNFGIQRELGSDLVLRADYLHKFGTRFIIGRTIGTVNNPVVGGPERVLNLESSVKTKYDGLLLGVEKRYANRYQFRISYTLSKSFNYANDDQIPFLNGPVDPRNVGLEYGPTPNDQRHRFNFSGVFELPMGFRLSPLWTIASGVPMDILLPDASSRIPVLQRNAGGRLFRNASQLNDFLQKLNTAGGIAGQRLPLVRDDARFNDSFNSFDLRVSKVFKLGDRASLEPIAEVFNLFNVTNVLGVSNVNYSGFANVLRRDSDDPASAGFLRSSSFGQAVTTAGGVFGTGGPRAFQFALRVSF